MDNNELQLRINQHVKNANTKLNRKKSIFHLYGIFDTYEESYDELIKASNLCLITGDIQRSCELREHALSLKTDIDYFTYKEYIKLAENLRKIDTYKSITVYQKIIMMYVNEAKFEKVAQYSKILSDIYNENLQHDHALEQLKISIEYYAIANRKNDLKNITYKYVEYLLNNFEISSDNLKECKLKMY